MPDPDPVSATSLGAVARAAGVSTMTVSRVFRGSPQVLPATRNRVLAAAKQAGYRPDPQVARLMALVRGRRARRVRVPLAVIRDNMPLDELHAPTYHYVTTDDIRRRAEQQGYHVEEFWLGRNGIGPARLGRILSTRGITGVLVSAQSTRQFSAQFNYAGLAAATFGYGLATPQLHRASTNMTQGILAAASLMETRGYRRIGMAISPWIDTRAGHTYSGAWLHYQQTVADARRVPLLLFPQNSVERSERIFREWMGAHRPDAVISFHMPIARWLTQGMGLRLPEDIGLVVHDWVPSMTGFAGIDHRRSHVAAAAVDLVATQLQHNEHGVPEVPRQILIPPRFVDGPSIRQR